MDEATAATGGAQGKQQSSVNKGGVQFNVDRTGMEESGGGRKGRSYRSVA